jgi:cytochrome c biogenesis protein ResB
MLMASSDAFRKGFQGMNNVLVRDWLLSGETGFPILKIWFFGLCFLMTLLGVNLIFCSWQKIFGILRARFNSPKFFMLIVHVIFGFVALFHLGGLMLGYEHNNIQLSEGGKYSFENGYEVEVKNVNVLDDYKVLERSSRYITRDEFDYRKNFAEVVLNKNGKEVSRDNIYLLSPMKYKDIQVTLRNFVRSPEAVDQKAADDLRPWVNLTVSKNPVLKIFLILYPVMIAGIFIYLILTWRSAPLLRDNIA